ncbi:hypothetical protein [Oligella ureolytica]|uniref:hypothetical protein n=1 Tax=Oligella ureolytica TaxID=90244 RepID=UPI0012EACDB8|nr:hypothetical protein [Oligella ureolytica]
MFTPEYKLSIIQQADACKHGEVGKLLRRESCIPTSWPNGGAICRSRVLTG